MAYPLCIATTRTAIGNVALATLNTTTSIHHYRSLLQSKTIIKTIIKTTSTNSKNVGTNIFNQRLINNNNTRSYSSSSLLDTNYVAAAAATDTNVVKSNTLSYHRTAGVSQSNNLNVNSWYDIENEEEELNDHETFHYDPVQENFITINEIRQRQRRLLLTITRWLKQTARTAEAAASVSPLILIASHPPQYQADTKIPVENCKQNTDFTYFTGLHSSGSDQLTADCVLALYLDNPYQVDESAVCSVLFAPQRTTSEQLWNGPDLANSIYGETIKQLCTDPQPIRPLSTLVEYINQCLADGGGSAAKREVFISRNGLQHRPELVTNLRYYMRYSSMMPGMANGPTITSGREQHSDGPKWSTALSGSIPSAHVRDASLFIDQLRSIKSIAECKALARIGTIGAQALKHTMQWSRNQVVSTRLLESHIAAKFDFETRITGAKRASFPSVCASGAHATIVHYGRNDCVVKPSDWILTDVGAEDVDGYCCDISRTWPLSLSSTSASYQLQLQLYEALTNVQRQLCSSIVAGVTSLDDLYRLMLNHLAQLLISFGAFDESVSGSTNISSLTRKICPHHVSHYIGLDIHDTPTVSRSKPLQPGMCFSIEPGLYFPINTKLPIKKEFLGIGLRIEDDLLIDPSPERGHPVINLTADCSSLQ